MLVADSVRHAASFATSNLNISATLRPRIFARDSFLNSPIGRSIAYPEYGRVYIGIRIIVSPQEAMDQIVSLRESDSAGSS